MEKKTKIKLTSEWATRDKLEFLNRLMTVLPDPDEILAENGYDFKIYRDLLTDPHLTATVQQRKLQICLLYTSPSPRDRTRYRMPSSA